MLSLKTEPNKVLGLAGIGPKAMQNIEETLAGLSFPEAEPAAVQGSPALEEAPVVEEMPLVEKQVEARKEAKRSTGKEEAVEDENAKDGVSLDELFKLKPEIFQAAASEEEDNADKKKGKKGKKKAVELVMDEELGEVVGRKKHKRGSDDLWEE